MGQLIRQLLGAARPHLSVPTPAGVPDKTPTGELSPETYLGYDELQYLDPPDVVHDAPAAYHFLAQDVYLVLGGAGRLDVSVGGHQTQTIDVGGTPRLYTLYQAGSATTGTLLLHASPGVQAYDFTFG
jgi:hypothetical protein